MCSQRGVRPMAQTPRATHPIKAQHVTVVQPASIVEHDFDLRCVLSTSFGVTCTASTPSVVALDTRHSVFPLAVDIWLTTGVPKPGIAVTLRLPMNEGASVYTLPETSDNWYRTPDVAFRDVALCDVSECDVSLTVLTCCALNPAASLCSGDVACNVNWFRPYIGAPDVADPLLLLSSLPGAMVAVSTN